MLHRQDNITGALRLRKPNTLIGWGIKKASLFQGLEQTRFLCRTMNERNFKK